MEFVIQSSVDTTSVQSLEHVISGGFVVGGDVTTDVGYNNSVPGLPTITGTIAPNDISMDFGNYFAKISFNFVPTNVLGAQSTPYLIIDTNKDISNLFEEGEVGFVDNLGATSYGFGYGALPEPKMSCLLSVLTAGIFVFDYLRKRSKA